MGCVCWFFQKEFPGVAPELMAPILEGFFKDMAKVASSLQETYEEPPLVFTPAESLAPQIYSMLGIRPGSSFLVMLDIPASAYFVFRGEFGDEYEINKWVESVLDGEEAGFPMHASPIDAEWSPVTESTESPPSAIDSSTPRWRAR